MKAMILAAGRGERMRPLTDTCPKPLLLVGGKPLIVWHLERLAAAGFLDIIINHAHLGKQIETTLGQGQRWNLRISYSAEPVGALETAGGIAQTLPMLGGAPFLVINSDIYCDWNLAMAVSALGADKLAHLVMVPNPQHHPDGDFFLDEASVGAGALHGGMSASQGANTPLERQRLTFSGIGIYRAEMFADIRRGASAKLAPLLVAAIAKGKISGELHSGTWFDIGTPERLAALNLIISATSSA